MINWGHTGSQHTTLLKQTVKSADTPPRSKLRIQNLGQGHPLLSGRKMHFNPAFTRSFLQREGWLSFRHNRAEETRMDGEEVRLSSHCVDGNMCLGAEFSCIFFLFTESMKTYLWPLYGLQGCHQWKSKCHVHRSLCWFTDILAIKLQYVKNYTMFAKQEQNGQLILHNNKTLRSS